VAWRNEARAVGAKQCFSSKTVGKRSVAKVRTILKNGFDTNGTNFHEPEERNHHSARDLYGGERATD
jgi:hypothetical protein